MYGVDSRQRVGSEGEGLDQYHHLHQQVEKDIYDNNAEIRYLDNKIVKNDYDYKLMQKLQARRQALLTKQAQLRQIVNNQDLLQQQVSLQRSNENNFKHSLGNQYIQLSQEKKRRAQQERRRVLEQQREVMEYHNRAMHQDQIRKKMQMQQQRRQVQQELAMRQQIRAKQKQEKERQKQEYNKKVTIRNRVETQKDSVYKQYYNHFMENQQKLQSIYRNKAAVSDRDREQHRSQFQRKQIQQYQQRVSKEQEERVVRMNQEKDMLRSFLQNQIQQKNRRKSRQKEEQQQYNHQVARYQMNVAELEQTQRSKKREEQKRYDQDLKSQTRTKTYSLQSGIGEVKQTHNPITNPIDFKIGITNPYIIRQYEQAKQRYVGDQQLKLRNLALVGSSSLIHS